MKKYQTARVSIELSQFTDEYMNYINLESDEEQKAYVEKIIREKCESVDDFSDDYDTIEEAKDNAYALYYNIKEGSHMRYLFIEYYEIWEVEYDEDGEAIECNCVDTIL